VRYSSDRVRAVIQYIPELDEDTQSQTWSAAEEQTLLQDRVQPVIKRPTGVYRPQILKICLFQAASTNAPTQVIPLLSCLVIATGNLIPLWNPGHDLPSKGK
jgi:hypothetical protein